MISVIPMKSYADPQLDTLLNIAIQARDNLGVTISQINNVTDDINQLYKQGSNETDALSQAVSQQDVSAAKQHFLAAMKFFKETNDKINSLNATSTSNDQQRAEINQLRGEIIRLENMGNLLKSIALQNNVNINFTNFDEMLQSANQDIDSGNLDDASKQIQSANDFVAATHNSLTEAAQEKISQRAKDFTEKQIAQLNVTQSNIVQQNNATQYNNTKPDNATQFNVPKNTMPTNQPHTTVNNSNITINSSPQDMVAELKHLVAEGKVDQAINLIKIIQTYQKAKLAERVAEVSTPPSENTTVSTPTPPTPPSENTTVSTPTPPTPPSENTTVSTPTPPTPPSENTTVSTPTPPTPPSENTTVSTPTPPTHQNYNVTQEHDSKNNDHEKNHQNTKKSEKEKHGRD